MIFYLAEIEDAIEGQEAYSTLKAAKAARDQGTTVKRVTTGKISREMLCAIWNRQGYAAEMKEVS
jgi:hypothetical protein